MAVGASWPHDLLEEELCWQSRGRKKEPVVPHSSLQVETSHRALYDRVERNVADGFGSIQRAMVSLQLQLQLKLKQLREQQEEIMRAQQPSQEALAEFEENMKKIDRSLEAFTAHADNLSHIKLTLARAAAFVSPDGNLAQLVSVAPSRRDWQDPMSSLCSGNQPPTTYGARQRPIAPPTDLVRLAETGFGPGLLSSQGFRERPEKLLERTLDKSLDKGFDGLDRTSSPNRIPNSTCFVFYLPPTATNESLRQLFVPYGTVLNAYVAMDKLTNRTRGFGFVDFSTPAEAQAAVASLDKFPLEGKYLSVSIKV